MSSVHHDGPRYTAYDDQDEVLSEMEYYSVGGGFVIAGNPHKDNAFRYIEEENPDLHEHDAEPPYMFNTAGLLLHDSWWVVRLLFDGDWP